MNSRNNVNNASKTAKDNNTNSASDAKHKHDTNEIDGMVGRDAAIDRLNANREKAEDSVSKRFACTSQLMGMTQMALKVKKGQTRLLRK